MAALGELLFYSGFRRPSLSDALRYNLENGVPKAVDALLDSNFQTKNDAQLGVEIVSKCQANALVLKLDHARGGASEILLNYESRWGERAQVKGLRITKEIPFDGDAALWQLQPSAYDLNPPRAEIRSSKVILGMDVPETQSEDAISYIEETIRKIGNYIERQAQEIADHNSQLPQAAAQAIARRRATLSKVDNIAKRLTGH
ncbi:hypothetical protein [uncultured Reyranella sp.]|uniref:hypothetical protein n=1 Tax=uncultured Reyranella sp. TaxID=735512 RepID=UPI00259CC4FD|nr:hypothetical protein [uncultured Reyranella sp.]